MTSAAVASCSPPAQRSGWEVYAAQHLEQATLNTCATILNLHLLPRLTGPELREIT